MATREGRFNVSGRAVADRLAGADVAHLQDAAREMNDGWKDYRPSRCGLAAIKRDAGPHQVISIGAAEQDAGRVGEARQRRRQSRAEPVEGLALRFALRMLAAHRRRRDGSSPARASRHCQRSRASATGRPRPPRGQAGSCRCRYAPHKRASRPSRHEKVAHSPISSALFSTGRRSWAAVHLGRTRHQPGKHIDDRVGKKRAQSARASSERRHEEGLAAWRAPVPARRAPCRGHRRRP